MSRHELQDRMRELEVPGERESEDRSWEVVREAYARRTSVPPRARQGRLVLALAGAVLVVVLLLSPAGATVRDWVGGVVEPGAENARPALTLPTSGRLLVESRQGPWIVSDDGSKRLLGDYEHATATWSPQGAFVAIAHGRELTAVVADQENPLAQGQTPGTVRWTAPGTSGPVRDPAWSPSGYRVAYRSGDDLRVIVGDGSDERIVATNVEPTPPAWRPTGERELLTYVAGDGTVRSIDADSGRELWHSAFLGSPVRTLSWSGDGGRLLVVTDDFSIVLNRDGEPVVKGLAGGDVIAAAFSPDGNEIALLRVAPRPGNPKRTELVTVDASDPAHEERLFAGPGPFTDLVWSPDGEWILLGWKAAGQWLFVPRTDARERAVADIADQFAPGERGLASFPRVAGWCCSD